MKALFKLSLFITSLSLTSCFSKGSASSSFSNSLDVTSEREFTYVDVIDMTISWNDIFSIERDNYYVYFYSRTCLHCNELKQFVIEMALNRDDIYFVEACSDIKYIKENETNLGVSSIDEFGIRGYPSLIKIEAGEVTKNLVGSAQIKKELTR